MTKNIVEELPTRKHPVAVQKPEAGKEKPQDPEKKVKQAVYDIRYRARREEVPLRTAYSQYMSNSGLGGNERTIVKKKLFGDGPMKENFVAEVESEAKEALANTLVKVFVGEDITSPKKYKVRVTDKSGKSYVRMADRAKITELRANSNIESVEMTDHGEPYEGEKKRGEQTAKAKGGGKLDPVGKEDSDVDNDGDVDKSDSYLMKRRKAIAKAMRKEEFLADAAVDDDKKKKMDILKGKNKITVHTKMKNGMEEQSVVNRFRSVLSEEDKVEDKKKEKEEADPRGMKTAISLYKNKLRAMGMKMEHHQKDKDGNTIPHEGEEINEVLGQLAGGALGTALGPKLAKVGIKNAIAQKAIGGAAGAAAGEILDPTKKMKDKNPVAAAAGGAAGGAIAGGGIGAASKALSNKFPETMSKIKNVVNPIKNKVSDIVGGKPGKGATSETTKKISSVADNIKKNDALKDKFKNNPGKYFGTEVNSYEPEGEVVESSGKLKSAVSSGVGSVVGGLGAGAATLATSKDPIAALGAAKVGAMAGGAAGAAIGAKKPRKGSAAIGGAIGGPVGAAIGASYEPEGESITEDPDTVSDKAYDRAKTLARARHNRKDRGGVGKNERAGYNLSQSQKSRNVSTETQGGNQTGGGAKPFGFARNKSNPVKSKSGYDSGGQGHQKKADTKITTKKDGKTPLKTPRFKYSSKQRSDMGFQGRMDKRDPKKNPKHTANKMNEGMATPESGTGKYYNEKKPTEMQLAKRKKMEKVKSLTNQGKHKEASALYKESIISKFNSKVKEEFNKNK